MKEWPMGRGIQESAMTSYPTPPDDIELSPLESLLMWTVVAMAIFGIGGFISGLLYAGWHQCWPDLIAAFGSLFV